MTTLTTLTLTAIALDAISVIRGLGQPTLADMLTQRLLDAQKDIYMGNPTIPNGDN